MIIYEVNLTISEEVYDAFITWLKPHIQEMLELDGFESAQLLQHIDTNNYKKIELSVRYRVKNEACLDQYLTHQAKAMRGKALPQFQGKFQASRKVLAIMDEFFSIRPRHSFL
ncbi:DUF4286 family protein [Legionella londiniensis]|uniref:DUF4286 domain-containing protein n=1 Tax=Legionella londiniensis TaxID=45068 RepID=A0A0W0VIH0_9GAMM|nr:DUF4286 family protein [Legionella londiniensis]KTD19918.1 hypothetical protein Llon_2090 [Legionella londiniensis]STX94210.1 Uncharacterised protein [Legionella londiniensis]